MQTTFTEPTSRSTLSMLLVRFATSGMTTFGAAGAAKTTKLCSSSVEVVVAGSIPAGRGSATAAKQDGENGAHSHLNYRPRREKAKRHQKEAMKISPNKITAGIYLGTLWNTI